MNLVESTPATERFLEQWNDGNDYITAHTSGSTGKPKGIRLLKSDMLVSASATCSFFGITGDSMLVCPLSADYIAGKMMIVRAISSGATLAMTNPSNRPDLTRFGNIDLLPVVPSQIEGILADRTNIDRIGNLLVGGGKTAEGAEILLNESGIPSWASYGMTETCSHVAVRPLGNPSSPYTALPGIIFDTDTDNCLKIISENFSWNVMQTNDIIDLIDNRSFRWLGRRDNVINSGGIKIIPETVEQKIADLIDRPFYITGAPDPKWGEKVILFIESRCQIDTVRLADAISHAVLPHERPKEIITVERFERTLSDKIKRKIITS
ncbi:MAG: AMP-binding protein [Muribaculaceae bacterium]|nr:AMP-binding protein [Muribaculaceae bacterium]